MKQFTTDTMLSQRSQAVLLVVLSLVNLAYILFHAHGMLGTPSSKASRPYTYHAHDFPEHLPLPDGVDMVSVVIEDSVHYQPLGNASDNAWLSTLSKGYGYVRLGPQDRTFVISMFHELHCLNIINRAFTKSPGATPGHLRHCLNYIRQEIMCSPDLTLEPGNFEEKDFEVERTGGRHICKDWGTIYRFMDENYDSWRSRSGYVDPLHFWD